VHDPHSHSNIEKKILRRADKRVAKYIAVSNYIKQDLIDSGIQADKISVLYNGTIIPDNFEKKHMPRGKLRIGIVGQIIPRKGHEDVIEACKSLTGTVSFELYVYGTGDSNYIQSLKDTIEKAGLTKNVIWKGFEADKKKVYESIDVVVAATRNDEPFALVALEAGAHKVPIIAAKSGGFPECIKDGVTGYIVPKQDSDSIASKLKGLYTDNNLLSIIGNAAYKNISEHFSIDIMHQKMRKVLSDIKA
jgi:glycosyltransferase involved in cell wall biosynthesis